jgi:hypothetical protein
MPPSLTELCESYSTSDYGRIDVRALRAGLGKVRDPPTRRGGVIPLPRPAPDAGPRAVLQSENSTIIVEWFRQTADSVTCSPRERLARWLSLTLLPHRRMTFGQGYFLGRRRLLTAGGRGRKPTPTALVS